MLHNVRGFGVPMMERFVASMETIYLWAKPKSFLLGVSGGCDSVALLHMLHSEEGIPPIKVVHFDHQQRGLDSDMDREFVVDLCQGLGVPVECFLWSNADTQLLNSGFSQATARDWRRSTMEEIAGADVGAVVLTAHHKDDSEETMLLKLLRGVHLTNIAGQSVMTESDETGITWARPLIDIRKHELQTYLSGKGLAWREDSSNRSSKYLRNRVRNELIPLLRDMIDEGSLESRMRNIEEQAKDLRDDLDQRIQGIDIDEEYFALPSSGKMDIVYRHALHRWAHRQGCTISHEQSKRIEQQILDFPDRVQWTLNIGHSWDVQRNGSILRLNNTSDKNFNDQASHQVTKVILPSSSAGLSASEYSSAEMIELYVAADSEEAAGSSFIQVACGNFPGRATFTPPWRETPMKLKDFLRGQKVPLHLRPSVEIIVAGDRIAAVKINGANDSKGKWLVDASFSPSSSKRKVVVYPDSKCEGVDH